MLLCFLHVYYNMGISVTESKLLPCVLPPLLKLTAALAEILKENRISQQLDVSHSSIGEGGATALAEILKENRISHNSVGEGGATALAEMLKENRMLQQLDVSYNSIGSGGASALVKMLKENRTL